MTSSSERRHAAKRETRADRAWTAVLLSALVAAASSAAVAQAPHSLGRVQSQPATETPRTICEAARDARARNSPAAPSLERQCEATAVDQVQRPPPASRPDPRYETDEAGTGVDRAGSAGFPDRDSRGESDNRYAERRHLRATGLHFVAPSPGETATPGGLSLRVAPSSGRTAEILIAWNSDPRGVTPVWTCRIALDQLISGVRLPASATQGRLGRFTLQARVIQPDGGPWSAPVDVAIADSSRDYPARRQQSDPVGDFECAN